MVMNKMVMNQLPSSTAAGSRLLAPFIIAACLLLLGFHELPLASADRLLVTDTVQHNTDGAGKDEETAIFPEYEHRQLIFGGGGRCDGFLEFEAFQTENDICTDICVGVLDFVLFTFLPFARFFSDADQLGSCTPLGEVCTVPVGDEFCIGTSVCALQSAGDGAPTICCEETFSTGLFGHEVCREQFLIGENCPEGFDEQCVGDAGCGRDGGDGDAPYVCCAKEDFNNALLFGEDSCNAE